MSSTNTICNKIKHFDMDSWEREKRSLFQVSQSVCLVPSQTLVLVKVSQTVQYILFMKLTDLSYEDLLSSDSLTLDMENLIEHSLMIFNTFDWIAS